MRVKIIKAVHTLAEDVDDELRLLAEKTEQVTRKDLADIYQVQINVLKVLKKCLRDVRVAYGVEEPQQSNGGRDLRIFHKGDNGG